MPVRRNTQRALRRLAAIAALIFATTCWMACSAAATPTPAPTAIPIQVIMSPPTPTATAAESCGTMCTRTFWLTATPQTVKIQLAQNPDLTAPGGPNGGSALNMAAAHCPTPEVIPILLDAGADLEFRSFLKHGTPPHAQGNTPLIAAAARNPQPGMVSTLLDHKADINAVNDDGHTALMAAAAFSANPDVLQVLLEHNADIEIAGKKAGITALHAAMLNRTPEAALLLLAHDADSEHRLKNSDTIIHTFARLGAEPTVGAALLLHSRPHLWDRNHKAETPCQIASERVPDDTAQPPFTQAERDDIIRLLCLRLQPDEEP